MTAIQFMIFILAIAGVNIAWALLVVPDRPIRFVNWGAAALIILAGITTLLVA